MTSQRLGRYALERKIATGGMAEIWLARQDGPAGFEKELVIKRILPHLADDEKFVAMFLDEARLAARLTHPNIVQIFDLGETEGDYFIAMEFIDGVDLSDVVERAAALGTTVPPAIAARLIANVCQALDYAHHFRDRDGVEVRLVHRDISPQNVLLSKSGIVKVVDFGVAKAATSQHKTQTGAVKGKLSYMSPEQISGKAIDGRSDLFALGIVLYELVTTQRPFGHESELLAVTAILNEQPAAPRTLVDGVPPELESIIFKALEKNADDRYASAREMQMALESVLHEMGALLSNRDLAEYLEDLFSESPTHTVGQLPALAATAVDNEVAQARRAAVTAPAHPSSMTRPGTGEEPTTQPDTVDRTGVQLKGALAGAASTDIEAMGPAPSQRRGVGLAVVLALLLVAGAGFGVWALLGGGSAGSSEEADAAATVVTADSDGDPSPSGEAALAALPDTAPDSDRPAPEPATAPDTGSDDNLGADAQPAEASGAGEEAMAGVAEPEGSGADAGEVVAAATEDASGEAGVAADEDASLPEDDGDDEADDAAPTEAVDVEAQASPPPRPRTGTLRVTAPPGVTQSIYIDGRQRGSTRMGTQSFDLPAGRYRVRVENADGERYETTVTVEPGASPRVTPRY